MEPDEAPDLKSLRYVLYARKSTEDDNRQVRSIPDQIRECKKLAEQLGLHIVGTIKETKSAKKPQQRPQFTAMLENLASGKKYDAILCWHPDRLARNMKEAGEIIDLLDEFKLKDIRFHSHQFTNDANGKMLLGMLFVFSKQYSDDLSTKVRRGVRGNFNEGKSSGSPKWGYTRNSETGLYEPNEFFALVQRAWHRRAEGDSLADVAKYLADEGYYRSTKPRRGAARRIAPTVNAVAKMFRDPFYYGLLVQAGQTVDLREIYDFEPMVDKETYDQVQVLSYTRTKDVAIMKRATFYPLRGFVYCDVCKSSKHMLVGKNKTGSGTYVLSYRCDNPDCTRSPKSLRAKNIFNAVYDRLSTFELTDEAYERYSKRLDTLTDGKIIAIKQQILSKRGALTHVKKELEDRALNTAMLDKQSVIYKANEKYVNELAAKRVDLEDEIKKLEVKIADPQQIKLTKAQFLNVVKTASVKMKAGTAAEKDTLCRILFLNLRVDNEKVASYLWREPFASMVKATELSLGADERT